MNKLDQNFKQILQESQSIDELFITSLNLCAKAEELINEAIIFASKPFQLNKGDNSNINNITDDISLETINNTDRLIDRLNGILEIINTNAITVEANNHHFIDLNGAQVVYQNYIKRIKNIRQEFNAENILNEIENNLKSRIINKQNELNSIEKRLNEIYNTYS
ncbi:hypothetical protein R84B8_02502 [Treponema sp. R8-4-B8]